MTTPQALTDPKEFNSLNLLGLIFKHWKKLAIIAVVAAVASAGASYLIKPKFKSSVILFPARQNSLSKSLLSENPSMSQDVLQFGEEEEAEQLIARARENRVRKLREAKQAADDELDIFKKREEEKFQSELTKASESDDSRNIEQQVVADLKQVEADYSKNRDKLVEYMTSKILSVKPELSQIQVAILQS